MAYNLFALSLVIALPTILRAIAVALFGSEMKIKTYRFHISGSKKSDSNVRKISKYRKSNTNTTRISKSDKKERKMNNFITHKFRIFDALISFCSIQNTSFNDLKGDEQKGCIPMPQSPIVIKINLVFLDLISNRILYPNFRWILGRITISFYDSTY